MSIYVKDHDDNCQKLCNTNRFPNFSSLKTLSWSRESKHTFENDCYVMLEVHWQSICIPVSAGDVLTCNKYFAGDIQILDLK